MSYESPLKMVFNEIENSMKEIGSELDAMTWSAVLKCGVSVDKEELIKALRYDRGQYEKGYRDRDEKIVRCKDCKYRSFYCTEATDGTTLYTCHYPCANDVPRPLDWFCADGKRRETE